MKTSLKIFVLSVHVLLSTAVFCQNQNLETTMPTSWSVTNGSISISNNHSKAGIESLRWDWNAGSVLTIDTPNVISAQVLDFYYNTFKMWVHNEVAATDTFTMQFLNSTGGVAYWFKFINNYEGWQQTIRSYLNSDMHRVGNVTSFSKVLLTAPGTGSGTLYIDNIDWVIAREGRTATPSQPDIWGYLSDYGAFLASSNWTKDIIVSTPTATDVSEMNTIYTRVINSISTSAPTAAQITSAQTSYATYNIVRSGNQIKGKPLTSADLGPIDGFILTLARAYYHSNNLVCRDMALDLIEHLIDQGFSYGSTLKGGFIGSGGYSSRNIGRAMILMQNAYSPTVNNKVYKMLQWQYDLYDLWNPSGGNTTSTDDIYLAWQVYTAAFNFAPTDSLKKQHLKGFQRWMNRILTPSKAQSEFFKTDYLGFHHNAHYNGYMYVQSSLQAILGYLDQTDFQVSQSSYRLLRNSMAAELTMSNKTNFANSHSGRNTFSLGIPYSSTNLLNLISIGGHIIGTGNRDDSLAAIYNRVWGAGANPLLTPIAPENATGFYQFNYGPFGMYRNNNYAVTLKGMNKDFWGAEIYATSNRYGRYQSYGTIEVMYDGVPATASGMNANGYNWNHPPGTTTIRMPDARLVAIGDRQDQYTTKRFSGALAFGNLFTASNMLDTLFGSSGMFAMDFQQSAHSVNHNTSFVFKKSVFAHNGMLVALGSNISNNNATDSTVTTLFQNSLQATNNPININGTNETTFPYDGTLAASSNNWLINSYNTGYFVPGNNDEIVVTKQNNISPSQSGNGTTTSGNISYAYINHKTVPSNREYEFVVMPNTNVTVMSNLATAMASISTQPYTILQKDSMAHIIKFNADTVYGYALFKANTSLPSNSGILKSNSKPVMVMTKILCDSLYLSLTNPDLNFTTIAGVLQSTAVPISIELSGVWDIVTTHPRATVTATTATSTIINFITYDGLPINIMLKKQFFNKNDTTICNGETIALTNEVVNNNITGTVTYYSTLADAQNQMNSLTNTSIAPAATAIYYLVHQADAGCVTIDSILINVNPKPDAGVDEAGSWLSIYNLNGNTTTGLWTAQVGNPIGPTVSTTTNGIAIVTFSGAATASNYYFIYHVNGCADTMAITLISTLPVKLVSFTAKEQNCETQLNWASATEHNFKHFEVQKSKDAVNFASVGIVAPLGSNSAYQFMYTPELGKSYYRLKMADTDGKTSYSNVVSLNVVCNDKLIEVYPNPAKDILSINISGYKGKVSATLFDGKGQLVTTSQFNNGKNSIAVRSLASGVYTLSITDQAGNKSNKKINVVR
jgi:chondroitin-sulfate-ABC endolyase/exolyase